jgi:hypothetical protein
MTYFRHLAISLLAAGSLLPATASFAADLDQPVKAIMDLVTAKWSPNPPEGKDYFDSDHIVLFSRDFAALYRETEKYPAFDEGSGPFDYDVITSSQEGCPLEDLKIVPGTEAAGATEIKVTFKLFACYGDNPDKDALSEVHFKVITEDGKSVIDEIDRIIDGKPNSLVAEMKDIIRAGREAPASQQE